MKNFVNVDTRFQKSINLTLDTGDMALVNRYIKTVSDKYRAGTGRTCNDIDRSLWKRKITSFTGIAGVAV